MADSTQHEATAELNEALVAAFAAGNFEGIGPFYTEDVTLLPPRGQPIEGRAGVGTFWSGLSNRFRSVAYTTVGLKDLGDGVRRESGTFAMEAADGAAASGKYLFVWRLVEGEWQIESGIWNRSPAAGGGAGQRGGGQGQGQRGRGAGGRGQGQGGMGQGGQGQGGMGQGGMGRGGMGQGGGQQGGYRQGGGRQGGNYRQEGGGYRGNRPSFQAGGSGLGGGQGGGGRGPGGGRGQGPGRQGGQGGGAGGGSLYDGGLYSGPKD